MFANQKFADTNYVRASEAIAEINFEKRSSPIQFFNYLTVIHDRPLVSFCWTAILILTSTFFFNLKAVSARRGKN